MQPRPHQSRAIDFAIERLKGDSGRCLAQLPTGSGKSLVKALVAKYWHALGRRVVVLTPSNVTVGKLFWELRRVGLKPEIDMGQKKAAPDSEVVLGTYATAWHNASKFYDPTALLILDECHHCNEKAESNLSIYRRYNFIFGVSASPWSGSCLKLFEQHFAYSLKESIRDGINCPFEIRGDASIGTDKYQLVFCPTNQNARHFSRQMPASDYVVYDADDKTGRVIKFKEGKISTMMVNRMLTEGFDLPPIKRVWIQRDTDSKIMAYQMLGRALRPFGDAKAVCYVRHPETIKTLNSALSLAGV